MNSTLEPAEMKSLLALLDGAIEGHPAFHPQFLRDATESPWTAATAAVIIPEYKAFIRCFPGCLARLVGLVEDDESRAFLGSILHEELGAGEHDRMHHRLFEHAVRASALLPGDVVSRKEIFPATLNLVAEMRHLYGHNDILVALGAQYALEKQALDMIRGVADGFSHVLDRNAEYFELHLRQEPEHHEKMKQCLLRYLLGKDDVNRAISGAVALLEALSAYWSSLAERSDLRAGNSVGDKGANLSSLLFEKNLLTALVNRLSDQHGSNAHELMFVEREPLQTAGRCAGVLDDLIGHFSHAIEPTLRVYLAVPNDDKCTHTIVMSRSQSGDGWQLGTVAGSTSNIAWVHSEQRTSILNDIRRAAPDENQEVADERAVANVPIIYANFGAHDECLAVLGISAPQANTISGELSMLAQRFATHLGVLIRIHLDARRGLRKRTNDFRKALFRHAQLRQPAPSSDRPPEHNPPRNPRHQKSARHRSGHS